VSRAGGRGLADERFAAYYDEYAVGLTAYLSAAIEANAPTRQTTR
jgi:hypothetical protein